MTRQQLEIREDEKTNTLTTVQKDNNVCVIDQSYKSNTQSENRFLKNTRGINEKAKCLTSTMSKGMAANGCTNLISNLSWRKLTPLECERLQTLDDFYTLVLDENDKQLVSNSRRYSAIGNGWTVDVIAHILSGIIDFN